MTGRQPLFSIVIPTYNRSELVKGAVQSVVSQSWDDFEVVVSDNCSEDNTREVVEAFGDPRVRYIRTPAHTTIGDSWEFARSHARGTLVMMLSDDDALVQDALARFAEEYRRHSTGFLFCNLAEYRDASFPGAQRNTVTRRAFSGQTRLVTVDEFLRPLFRFSPPFVMHPSAFMFEASIADQVVRRSGRFFRTNGVEYFAWPLAAVFSGRLVYIDQPLVILGRTSKSWGSNVVLSNPGKQQIQKMIADVEQKRDWIPLTNFTLCNLMAEGMLLAKRLFPDELSEFPFDEHEYLRKTMHELHSRAAMGVEVDAEMRELLQYASRYPALQAELISNNGNGNGGVGDSYLRKAAKTLGLHHVRRRMLGFSEARKIRRGDIKSGFHISGETFGFSDAVGCADFLFRVTARSNGQRAGE